MNDAGYSDEEQEERGEAPFARGFFAR